MTPDDLVTPRIRRLMWQLPEGAIFTTRQLLQFGKRESVDQATWRMVRSGEIQRLTYGVFRRNIPDLPLPTAHEIAKAKADWFKKEMHTHGKDAAHQLNIIPEGNEIVTFATNGATSVFHSVVGPIRFVRHAARKIVLGDSPVALVIRALWFIGRNFLKVGRVLDVLYSLGREERQLIQNSALFMPAWMSDPICNS